MSSELFPSHPIRDIEAISGNLPDLEEVDLYILKSPLVQGVIQLIHRTL